MVRLILSQLSDEDSDGLQCPMHKNLVDVGLLSVSERNWLNSYHEEVWDKVSPLLQNDSRALSWLKRECSPV
ncbi:hypothetical protein PHLCEN_2v2670 [Hermanssonia centrifuga]|uniref:Peptidase M24 C-terminal domain-containing protein n=1 Tax=Hermanssonia centrifuga TaxID=98765 RepID=A0A2R6RII3_9APHY|nr:hypothetical protein PHLCEN_2v2670 [Hermanssonia centrifuga]